MFQIVRFQFEIIIEISDIWHRGWNRLDTLLSKVDLSAHATALP
jgi:hypothetical protein